MYLPLNGINYPYIYNYSLYNYNDVNNNIAIDFTNSTTQYELSDLTTSESKTISSTKIYNRKYNDQILNFCSGDEPFDYLSNSCITKFDDIYGIKFYLNNGEVILDRKKFGIISTTNSWFFSFWIKLEFSYDMKSDFIIFGQYIDESNSFCVSNDIVRNETYSFSTALFVKFVNADKKIQLVYQINDSQIVIFERKYSSQEMNHFVFAFSEETLKVYINQLLVEDEENYLPISKSNGTKLYPAFNPNCSFLIGKTLEEEIITTETTYELLFIDYIGISTYRFRDFY